MQTCLQPQHMETRGDAANPCPSPVMRADADSREVETPRKGPEGCRILLILQFLLLPNVSRADAVSGQSDCAVSALHTCRALLLARCIGEPPANRL